MQNTRFSQLNQVACKSPGSAARTLKNENFENFSKCFSWLNGLPARKSRGKPRKSLCTPHDWTFHPRTSHHTKPREKNNKNNKNLKNILSIFHDWYIDSPMSCEKSLCGRATRACDWINPQLSRQNRATLFFKILTIFAKTKYFPKTSKTLKNIFVFYQQRLSMWKHI